MAYFGTNSLRRIMGLLAVAFLSHEASSALAQTSDRSSFPGRRIGGGTRGECAARVLAHLVPGSSVFAPGSALTVGLLLGPTANPRPIQVQFRPQGPGGTAAGPVLTRELPPAPTGVTLLSLGSLKGPQVWESSFRCADGREVPSSDPLSFVETVSPPALSLLVTEVTAKDQSLQQGLQKLTQLCGSQVPKAELAKSFDLEGVMGPDWPELLPVRCP